MVSPDDDLNYRNTLDQNEIGIFWTANKEEAVKHGDLIYGKQKIKGLLLTTSVTHEDIDFCETIYNRLTGSVNDVVLKKERSLNLVEVTEDKTISIVAKS